MDSTALVAGTEELREALLAATRERDALMLASSHAQHLLDALDSLLSVAWDDDPFERVFAALRKVFTFSQSMILAAAGETVLECIVAEPISLVGSRWRAGALFRKVMAGRVVATFSNAGVEEWRGVDEPGLTADQSALYAPVRVRDRRGILMLLRDSGDAGFDRNDVELARKFSVLASHALAARYASQTEVESRHLRELTEQLQHSEQVAKRNADLLNEVVNVLPVGVTVQDEHGTLLLVNDVAAAAYGHPAARLRGTTPFDLPGGKGSAQAQREQHLKRTHGAGSQNLERTVEIGADTHTLLTTYKPVRIFDEALLLTAWLDITDRKTFENELSRRAFHDQLTGLPNRALMAEIVESALRAQRRAGMFALAFIDLDNFKQVNDYYSHAHGDALLCAVAERVQRNVRPGDTLARISGDEFLLLFNPIEGELDLPPLIERIVESLKQPFTIEGVEILTSASVGASVYPLHGDSYETLRRCADSAMYRAKRDRKGSVSYFNAGMGEALTARMALEQRLRAAVRDRSFKAAFQPKVCLKSGATVGFEALVRWVEADGKVHMPGCFIELAGELGLLDEITTFVLEDVERGLPQLAARYGPDISVSLNIAAKQAGDAIFMASFARQVDQAGIGARLIVELTEDAFVAAERFQREVLPELRRLGVRVSIDDFGTGYSSLATLADLTADEVKVDRAFITAIHQRVRSQGILKAIESLCSALEVSVVAEGVECEEELAYLREHTSIQLGQGYYFAKPKFIEAMEWVKVA
jgi:cyclic di-GMP phosphodiesterase Gmr